MYCFIKNALFFYQAVLRMICTPESVSTNSEIAPTFNAKVACSKGACIYPGPNSPRSPPLWAEPHSEYLLAS